MGENSKIEWTDHTFNQWIGCQRVSAACDNCYAAAGSARLAGALKLKLWDEGSTRHITSVDNWKKPYVWNRKAEKAGERHRVFCASYADIFEMRPELVDPRGRVLQIMEETPHLDYLLLTKRIEHVKDLVPRSWMEKGFPKNIWMGTTVENVPALGRIIHLLQLPAVVRFISAEPLLEDIAPYDGPGLHRLRDGSWYDREGAHFYDALRGASYWSNGDHGIGGGPTLDWVIVGGESGAKARPFELRWARNIVRACGEAKIACFVKQLGAKPAGCPRATCDGLPHHGPTKLELIHKKGGDWDEWPEDLRVREFPTPRAQGIAA